MRVVSSGPTRPATQVERIAALEEGRKADTEKLASIETKLDEIHTLLVGAKAILWLGTKVAGWITAAAAVIGTFILVARFIMGR